MKIFKKIKFIPILLLIAVMQFVLMPIPEVFAATTTVNLGTVDGFAAFAAESLGDTGGASLVTGDVGLTPASGTYYTGLTSAHVTGTIYTVDAAGPDGYVTNPTKLTTAIGDLGTAYDDAAGRTPFTTLDAGDNQLGGQTLTSGVYRVAHASTANITGTLTLTGDADSVFIFQMSSDLITASNSKVVLSGGVQSCHVFWQVGSSTTLGTSTTFIGNMLTNTTIIDDGYSTVDGRLLAGAKTGSGALTLNHTTLTKSTCATTTTTTSSSTSGLVNDTTSVPAAPYCLSFSCVTPIILESRRVDADSIFLSWGPYTGMNTYNIQYGVENGKWLYNTNVTGFSTTLNQLPPNQAIWFLIQPRDNCSIGPCGVARLVGGTGGVGGPRLPNTGFGSEENNIPWNVTIPVGSLVGILVFLGLIQRRYRFLSRH